MCFNPTGVCKALHPMGELAGLSLLSVQCFTSEGKHLVKCAILCHTRTLNPGHHRNLSSEFRSSQNYVQTAEAE